MAFNGNGLEKVTSLDYLKELSKGNSGFVQEMIRIFLTENPKELTELATAIHNKDFTAIRQVAHRMQSSLPFVGVNKVIEQDVMEIERLGENRCDLPQILHLFSKVKAVCERAQAELR